MEITSGSNHMQANANELPVGRRQKVLISGASFAGLVTAWWMNKLGHAVTVVEMAPDLRRNGVPADLKGDAIEVIRQMGLLERLKTESLPPQPMIVLDEQGAPLQRKEMQQQEHAEPEPEEYEIERSSLLTLFFSVVRERTEFLFSDSIANIEEGQEQVEVTFASGKNDIFSLVIGCDGSHSTVRKLCFGEEESFITFLKNYFSLTIVPRLLIRENTSEMFNLPGRSVILNAYNGKTDVIFSFASQEEISYNRKDQQEQKRMIRQAFQRDKWRIPELLDEMDASENAYFDRYCQVHMDSWTKGRIALVGDAAYAPSPAGGNGCSVAVMGAAALGKALEKHRGDLAAAFQEYNESYGPVVKAIQAQTTNLWLEAILPASQEAIQRRNERFGLSRA